MIVMMIVFVTGQITAHLIVTPIKQILMVMVLEIHVILLRMVRYLYLLVVLMEVV